MKSTSALLVVACGLSLADALLRLTYGGRSSPEGTWPWLFDATREASFPTWFSIGAMAGLGVACLRNVPGAAGWLVGLGFVYLALDDALMIHERVGEWAMPWLSGHGVYTWVLLLVPVFAIGGLYAAWQMWRSQPEPRGRALLLIGMAMLACALALEAMESWSERSGIQLRGLGLVNYTKWVEETFELLAPVILMRSLPRRASSTPLAAERALP